MSNPANWSGGVPVSGSENLTLIMNGVSADQNIASPLELQSLTLNGFFHLAGNPIRFNNLGAAPTFAMDGGAGVTNDLDFAVPMTIALSSLNGTLSWGLPKMTGSTVTLSAGARGVTLGGSGANTISLIANGGIIRFDKASSVAGSLVVNSGTVLRRRIRLRPARPSR